MPGLCNIKLRSVSESDVNSVEQSSCACSRNDVVVWLLLQGSDDWLVDECHCQSQEIHADSSERWSLRMLQPRYGKSQPVDNRDAPASWQQLVADPKFITGRLPTSNQWKVRQISYPRSIWRLSVCHKPTGSLWYISYACYFHLAGDLW